MGNNELFVLYLFCAILLSKEYFIEIPTDYRLQDYLVDEAIEMARKSSKNKRLALRKANVNKNTNN